jgi:hypothetical protein
MGLVEAAVPTLVLRFVVGLRPRTEQYPGWNPPPPPEYQCMVLVILHFLACGAGACLGPQLRQ